EYIHEEVNAKTLFSTHYHELTDLEDSLEHVKNIHVRAEEYEDNIVFLHKIEEGRADQSYGIHVAKLAQLPESLISRANTILNDLENANNDSTPPNIEQQEEHGQLAFFAQ